MHLFQKIKIHIFYFVSFKNLKNYKNFDINIRLRHIFESDQ
jgi:hypothetical protein